MLVSVIIPTYNRPDCVRKCLRHLMAQDPLPAQIIVVDASFDDRTSRVVEEFPLVKYLRNDAGRGNTPNSRNLALLHCTSDIVAFLDDDSYARPGWMRALVATYADPEVAGVAGRALNGQPGEERVNLDEIGRLKPNGTLSGNFTGDPGKIIEVDHMIGCNMSLRRDVMMRLGGFKDDFRAGPFGICEETEICIRAKRLGYRLVYNAEVCADHVGATQPGGRRFSPKYSYYHSRNLQVMLIRNYGWAAITWRSIGTSLVKGVGEFVRKCAGAIVHLVMVLAGLTVGIVAGTWLLVIRGRDPIRRDKLGLQIAGGARHQTIHMPSSATQGQVLVGDIHSNPATTPH